MAGTTPTPDSDQDSRSAGFVDVALPIPGSLPFTYHVPEDQTPEIGCRVIVPVGRRSQAGFVVAHRAAAPDGVTTLKQVTRVVTPEPLFEKSYLKLADWISGMYLCSLGEALSVMIPGGRRETELPEPALPEDEPVGNEYSRSPEQEHAVRRILSSTGGRFYLYGVTGSGKTEVFLSAAAEMLAQGKGVIYLVPEIALSHQMIGTIRRRLGEVCAVLHSRLTPSQRLTEWGRVRTGRARFVLGARSAVFAPVADLGLIILDEEHESSYKSGSHPRYHARQVAMKRAAQEGACLVMGSATPSVEAWHMMRSGGVEELRLAERVSGGGLPEISILDLRKERGSIGRELAEEIRRTARAGRQSILFLNRRGFAYFFHCKSCGFQMTCRRCSVALTYHKSRNAMICHYCGYKTAPIEVCPDCRSLDLGYSGFGTEKVEEDLGRLFPELSVRRLDTDTVRRKGELENCLDDFRSGRIDILLGTQMVAKGLNFPGVRLVGIVAADMGLQLPDFRAAERTFSLIVQVAGRAGRYAPDGKVIVQTYRPHHEAIQLAAACDLEEFYRREIEMRRELGFPPHYRLIRIVFRGKNAARTVTAAEEFSARLRQDLEDAAQILGPAECPLSIISGQYRYQCILRTKSFGKAHSVLGRTLKSVKAVSGVFREIDPDPVSLL